MHARLAARAADAFETQFLFGFEGKDRVDFERVLLRGVESLGDGLREVSIAADDLCK